MPPLPPDIKDRRPIQARNAIWAKALAKRLANSGCTPNRISLASILFSLLAGLCFAFCFLPGTWLTPLLLMMGAAFVQIRLICNLLDGMVAIEGGKKTPTGDFFNDFPDRVSDPLILIGLGYGLTSFTWGGTLGWAAALLALMTAYTRLLGGACKLDQDFSGPMAKQHRMALVTLGAVVAAFLPSAAAQILLLVVLALITAGGAFTVLRRARRICTQLQNRGTTPTTPAC